MRFFPEIDDALNNTIPVDDRGCVFLEVFLSSTNVPSTGPARNKGIDSNGETFYKFRVMGEISNGTFYDITSELGVMINQPTRQKDSNNPDINKSEVPYDPQAGEPYVYLDSYLNIEIDTKVINVGRVYVQLEEKFSVRTPIITISNAIDTNGVLKFSTTPILIYNFMPMAVKFNADVIEYGRYRYDLSYFNDLTVMVCNNADDPNPIWEDMTEVMDNNEIYYLKNRVCSKDKYGNYKWAVQFKVQLTNDTWDFCAYTIDNIRCLII